MREPLWYIVLVIIPIIMVVLGTLYMKVGYTKQNITEELTEINLDIYNDTFSKTISFQPTNVTTELQEQMKEIQESNKNYTIKMLLANTTFAKYLNSRQIAVVKEISIPDANYTVLKLFFNDTYVHSIPMALNTITNWYSQLNGLGKIILSSIPVGTVEDEERYLEYHISASVVLIGLAMSLIPVGLAFDIVKDRLVSSFVIANYTVFLSINFTIYHAYLELHFFRLGQRTC